MTSLARVNAPASVFLDCIPGAVTVIDLAYDEYCNRSIDGDACAHVEAYFSYLGRTYPDRASFKVVECLHD